MAAGNKGEHMGQEWGWAGSSSEFRVLETEAILQSLGAHHLACMHESPSGSQITAWREEIDTLRRMLASSTAPGGLGECDIVLEYELPREAGRRPDVVLLSRGRVLVLEFKSSPVLSRAHLDQVSAYARDLSEYHSASHNRQVIPVLVLVSGDSPVAEHYGVTVTNAEHLAAAVESLLSTAAPGDPLSLERWLSGEYAPLPSLVVAARTIFSHEPLPRIRRAYSSGVEDAVEYLRTVARRAARDGGMHLALVAGVPGAGKTLVGLRFVYETHFGEMDSQEAVFLSGNGPLVKVLQHTLSNGGLEGRVFVRDVHAFLKSYGGDSPRSPKEHMWVYDEAQRAWDVEKVREKRPAGYSEPEDFLKVGEKLGDWAVMVGLIGEGQEIYVGEESGLAQWNEALANVDEAWTVHCPPRVADVFRNADGVNVEQSLDLTVTLRSHKAEELHDWVAALLDGQLDRAKVLAGNLKLQSFSPLITRDIAAAFAYAQTRYEGAPEGRFGMMMSSQRKWASAYGFMDDFYMNPGPWFGDGEDSPHSCRRLEKAVTEFQCQGLELDMPLIGWGGDLLWQGGWLVPGGVRKRLQDPEQITMNVYRVLLTRGRDGFIVFVPPRPELDGVFAALEDAGCDRLELVPV